MQITMSIEKIQRLLKHSDQLFTKRSLEQAMHIAHEALELSTLNTYRQGIIQSNLLLGKIHATSGKYNGDKSHFPKALQFIRKAEDLNQPPNENGYSAAIFLAFGEVFQNSSDYISASQSIDQALKYCRENSNNKGEVLSLCILSRLNVLKNELDIALDYAKEALDLIDDESDEELQAEVYNQLSQVYIKKQEYSKILDYSEKVLQISRRTENVEKELSALNNIAIYYGVKADYKTAMQYFLDALDKSKSIGYRYHIANSLINIATIYASLFNYKEAIDRYQTVLKDYKDSLESYTQVIIYNNLGNIYYHDDQPERAKANFEKAYELAVQTNYKEMMAHSLAQKSRSEAALSNYEVAYEQALAAQELFEGLGEVNGRQINLINLGNILYHKKEVDQAVKYTSQGIVVAKRMKDDISEIRGYQLLANIYQEMKDFEKALKYQVVFSKAQEKFSNVQISRQIVDYEIDRSIKEKQKKIEQLTRENEIQALLLEQTDKIKRQNQELSQVNEELRQYAYVASHDLKEPLRMIGSYTQLIERIYKDQQTEDSQLFFKFVNEGVNRMNNLLDDLLRYATIGNTEAEKRTVKIVDIVEVSIKNLRLSIEESKAVIHYDQLPEVYSINSLLIQLFQNLISNAVKFRNAEAQPEIEIACIEKADLFEFSIKDNGIGIAPEFKKRIFVIFQRLHARTEYEGTGIGLAICQKIVQRLGGKIWVDSESGKGATFYFTLPKKGNE